MGGLILKEKQHGGCSSSTTCIPNVHDLEESVA